MVTTRGEETWIGRDRRFSVIHQIVNHWMGKKCSRLGLARLHLRLRLWPCANQGAWSVERGSGWARLRCNTAALQRWNTNYEITNLTSTKLRIHDSRFTNWVWVWSTLQNEWHADAASRDWESKV